MAKDFPHRCTILVGGSVALPLDTPKLFGFETLRYEKEHAYHE